MISKCLSTSERYASLEQHAGKLAEFCQALFPLLVAHADDHGRQAGDEFTIKHLVHPTSKRKLQDFTTALRALHDSGLVSWYQVKDAKFLQIEHFDEHQTGLHHRRESKIPALPGDSGNAVEVPLNRTETKRNETKRTEEVLSSADADYEAFRTAYPASRRVGGKAGKRAFAVAIRGQPPGHIAAMLSALEQHKRSEQWQIPRLIPLMTTWLSQERWTQVLPEPSGFGGNPKTAGNVAALQRFAEKR
jgi:hypothetical protein